MDFRREDILRDVVEFAISISAPRSEMYIKAKKAAGLIDRERPRLTPGDKRCGSGQGAGSLSGCVNEPNHPGFHNWID